VGSCDRVKGEVCAKKGKGLSVVKGGKRGGKRVHQRIVEKRIYLTVKVTTNSAGILYREKGWEKVDGTRLPIFE